MDSMSRANQYDGELQLSIEECNRLRAVKRLSPRQIEVLRCLIERGASDKQIRKSLHMSRGTLNTHLEHLRLAFGGRARLQLVEHALAFLRPNVTTPTDPQDENGGTRHRGSGL